jgi:hypothetical protein
VDGYNRAGFLFAESVELRKINFAVRKSLGVNALYNF